MSNMWSNRPLGASAPVQKIAICGAGIGGLTLAIRLAGLGFEVVVFERRDEAAVRREGAFLTLAANGGRGWAAFIRACPDFSGISVAALHRPRRRRRDFADKRARYERDDADDVRRVGLFRLPRRCEQARLLVQFVSR